MFAEIIRRQQARIRLQQARKRLGQDEPDNDNEAQNIPIEHEGDDQC